MFQKSGLNLKCAFSKSTNGRGESRWLRGDTTGIANAWLEENSLTVRQDLGEKVDVFGAVIILLPWDKYNSVLDTRSTKMNMTKYPQGVDFIWGRLKTNNG